MSVCGHLFASACNVPFFPRPVLETVLRCSPRRAFAIELPLRGHLATGAPRLARPTRDSPGTLGAAEWQKYEKKIGGRQGSEGHTRGSEAGFRNRRNSPLQGWKQRGLVHISIYVFHAPDYVAIPPHDNHLRVRKSYQNEEFDARGESNAMRRGSQLAKGVSCKRSAALPKVRVDGCLRRNEHEAAMPTALTSAIKSAPAALTRSGLTT